MPRGRNNTNKKKRETRKERVERKEEVHHLYLPYVRTSEEDPNGLQTITDCLQQASVELETKVKNIKSLHDIEDCISTEEKYLSILTCQLEYVRPKVRDELKDLVEKRRELKTEFDIINTWRSTHYNARQLTSPLLERIERGFKPRPNIKITFSRVYDGEIITGLSERIPEFSYRCAQADAHFRQLIETYCCYPESTESEKGIPQGDFINSPGFYLHPKTRRAEHHYILNPLFDLGENQRRHLDLFLETTVRDGILPFDVPYIHVPDYLLPDDHPNNSVPDY